ncbi:alkaline phosphatase PhoX [Terrabacter sp. GCM10028922]|uniref:alkaline phosphatase PhoX n=1 Tax=Terrabacter sp. GCM10028922 TaxID=3273428 RepID=UPI00360B056C
MTSSLDRRGFLEAAAATGLGIAISGSIEVLAGSGSALAAPRSSEGYGPLVPDPNGLLSLPEGFSYRIVSQTGVTPTADGVPTASDPDGNGVFARGTGSTIVNNHEISGLSTGSEKFGVPTLAGITYDPGARGGTSNIEVDAEGVRIREYASVAGTHTNCAGGETPWGTWLTCEESEQRKGGRFLKDHGYVFEVDPTSQEANIGKSPVPLTFLGRFAHEAVSVDPATHVIYETEDAATPSGLYYRWTPPAGFSGAKDALRELALSEGGNTAGQLEAMSCYSGSTHIPDLSLATHPGTRYKVVWKQVPDRDARVTSVRKQFADHEITRSRKLEGAWWGDGGAYFVASFARVSDGSSANDHDGQVWFYDPASEAVTLTTIFAVNPDPNVDSDSYDGPDNMTLSPYGGIILAEDGGGIQHLVGVTDQGKSYPLARNDRNTSEFAGPAFSADGSVLFVGIQSPGHVFAITGPWARPSNAQV